MQCIVFVMQPMWAVFFTFSLPPSADSAFNNIISTNGKQDVLKQPEANTNLSYFLAVRIFETRSWSEFFGSELSISF